MKIDKILKDIESKLNIKIEKDKINYFTEGATKSIVFSIHNKYLIKTMTNDELKTQIEFLNMYNNDYFQKIEFYSEEYNYICFKYIEGEKIKDYSILNLQDIINQLYEITKSYKKYNYDGYGYLYEDNKNWYSFLKNEIMYAKKYIDNIDINFHKVEKSLEIIKKYKIDKYLIHGDFGTHNFLVNSGKIKVIDPMPVVGDYLYDFYFSILSNSSIFKNIDINYILDFYDRNLEYKKHYL